MKRIICLAVAMICILAMAACNTVPTPGSTGKSKPNTNVLMGKGLELISEVDKLAECQEYTDLYTSNKEILDVINGIASNDYTEPKTVFIIENLDVEVIKSMQLETKLPVDIEEMVRGKLASAFPSQINALNGAMNVAATSILNHEDSFIYDELKSSAVYLYTYNNGYGFMVTYTPDDENIVKASVTVIINDELSECATIGEVINFFDNSLNLADISVSVALEQK